MGGRCKTISKVNAGCFAPAALSLCAVGLLLLGFSPKAHADVEGIEPAFVDSWRLFGSHTATGAALMVPGPYLAEINSVLLPSSTGDITDVPFDGEVAGAFLFWSGSLPRTNRSGPPGPPDSEVTFTTADGSTHYNLSAYDDMSGFGRCVTTAALGGFYYCRRDVTDMVRQQGPGNANGMYTVGDVDADVGVLSSFDPQWPNAQAKYAAWSLLLVWQGQSEPVRRDVVLYDGFLRLDETATASGWHTFNVGNFLVGSPALGKLTVFGLEGDRQLGVPPQDATGCPTCWDFISYRSGSAPSHTVLQNGSNPPYNSFNSSWMGQPSIDIDTYNLQGLINTGDTSAQIVVGSGDNIVPDGGGESFFVGWLVMSIDTLAPSFRGTGTRKRVQTESATGGQTLFYTIDLENQGSAPATGVSVLDPTPTNTAYVANTTRVDGFPVADVGGQSPLANGLSLGTISAPASGDHRRQVTFQVRVLEEACDAQVQNHATISANEVDDVQVSSPPTTIGPAQLEPPTKSVQFLSPPPVGPGTAFAYTIELENSGASDAGGIRVRDPLPQGMQVASVFISHPGASYVIEDGVLDVANITIPAAGTTHVVISGRVLTVSEFSAAGVPASALDGYVVSNQATVSGGCNADMLTDDPDAGGFQPTEFTLTYAPALSTSQKSVDDLNGGDLEPNDVLRYTIVVSNTGNRPADVVVTDAIPPHTTYVAGSTQVDGAAVADGGGTSPLVSGYTIGSLPFAGAGEHQRIITFEVQVQDDVANEAVVQNTAQLTVPVYPNANTTVVSPALTVLAAANWQTSIKTVVDLTAPVGTFRPSDQVQYTIVVENTGNRVGTNVRLHDILSPHLIFTSASDGGVLEGGEVRWNLGNVAAGEQRTLTLQAQIQTPLDNGTQITNGAEILSDELSAHSIDGVSFTVSSAPNLLVQKIDEHPSMPIRPGDAVVYRIRIQNNGDMTAQNIVASDPLDAALTNVVAPTGVGASGTITWSSSTDARLAQLLPGDMIELLIYANVRSPLPVGTQVANQATVQAAGFAPVLSDDPKLPGTVDPTVFDVLSTAALSVHKSVQDLTPDTPFQPGDRVRYRLVVTAAGDAPSENIRVTDTLPIELEDLASPDGALVSGNSVQWRTGAGPAGLASLAPGQSLTLMVDASVRSTVADEAVVLNQAEIQVEHIGATLLSDGDLQTPGEQPTSFMVVARPMMTFFKSVSLVGDSDGAFNPGDDVRYVLRLENIGTGVATNISIDDELSQYLVLQNSYGAAVSGHSLSWSSAQNANLAALAPGTPVELQFTARIQSPLAAQTVVQNQATLNFAQQAEPMLSNDPAQPGTADPTRFTVQSLPSFITSTKTVQDLTDDPLITRPGDLLEYTLTITNSGTDWAQNVVVDDPLPLQVNAIVPANGRLLGSTLRWDSSSEPALANLAPATSVILTFQAQVQTALANGTVVSNQGFISSDEQNTPTPTDDPGTAAAQDATRVLVVSSADLGGTTKTVTNLSGSPIVAAAPGEMVRFHIAVGNRGDENARSVAVVDHFDSRFKVVAAPFAAVNGQTVRWDSSSMPALTELPPNETVSLSVDVRIDESLPNGTVLLNQGEVTADNLASATLTDADPTTLAKESTALNIVSQASLAGSTKQFFDPATGQLKAEGRPGENVRMVIVVRNTGNAPATNVQLSDVLDTNILTNLTPRDGGLLTGNTVTWTFSAIAGGAARTVRIDARIRTPLDPSTLVNQASIVFDGADGPVLTHDPSQPGEAAPSVMEIISAPNLSGSTKDVLGKTIREVNPGEIFTYRIMVSNSGDGNARDIEINDVLDANLSFVGASQGGTYTGGAERRVRWQLPVLLGGESQGFDVQVQVAGALPNGTIIDNQGLISGSNFADELTDDPQAASANSVTRLTVMSRPSFGVFHKTVRNLDALAPGLVRPGDRLEYTFELVNDGNAPAEMVEIRDPIDMSLLSEPTPINTFRLEGNEVVFDSSTEPALASLGVGETISIKFVASVAPGVADATTIINQGVANAQDLLASILSDGNPSSAEPEPTAIVVRYPMLAIAKSASGGDGNFVEPGQQLDFLVKVQNTGSIDATDVMLQDPLLAPLELLDAGGAQVTDGTAQWNIGQLAAGQELSFTLSALVPEGTPHGTLITNQAVVQGLGAPAVQSNTVELTTRALPRFEIFTKEVISQRDPLHPGDIVHYRLALENTGTGEGTDVRLTDPLPIELELETVSEGGTFANGELLWIWPRVAVGEQRQVEFSARVKEDTAHRTEIANQAQVGAAESQAVWLSDDPSTEASLDPTVLVVTAEPNFATTTLVGEDLNGGILQPGDRVRYTLQVRNDGTSAGFGVKAQLSVPSYANYVRGSTRHNGLEVDDVGGLSPLAQGLVLRSAASEAAPGVVLVQREGNAEHLATVSFEIRVDPRAPPGVVLSAQGIIASDGFGPTPSDNPATPTIPGDATVLVVGGGAELVAHKLAQLLSDNQHAEVGDVLRYTVRIANAGSAPATEPIFTDMLPTNADFVPQSLRVDGAMVDEAGVLSGGRLSIVLDDIAPGAERLVAFEMTITEGPALVNQAEVALAGRVILSDGNPSLSGNQPTVTSVGSTNTLASVYLEAFDDDGGVVAANDSIRLHAVVRNDGTQVMEGLQLRLQHHARLLYESFEETAGIELAVDDGPAWHFTGLYPGEQRLLALRMRVHPESASGDALDAMASVLLGGSVATDSEPVTLVVGSGLGSAQVSGRVYWRRSDEGAGFVVGVDEPLQGFAVYAIAEGDVERASRDGVQNTSIAMGNAIVAADGTYRFANLPRGRYEFWALSPEGTVFGRSEVIALEGAAGAVQDFAIDPSGIIYQVRAGNVAPVGGTRVYLVDFDTGQDIERGDVLGGQQGQVTSSQGLYRFDVRSSVLPGRFYLRVETPSAALVFPSEIRPPAGADAQQPLGVPAAVGADGRVVGDSFPNLEGESLYYLRFDLSADSPNITNNHVPLDPLSEHVQISKAVDRRTASIGEILTYSVTVTNRSSRAVTMDDGGVSVLDDLPMDLHWVEGSAYLESRIDGRVVASRRISEAARVAPRTVRFGPFEMPPQSVSTIRYQLVVGIRADGERINRARLMLGNGTLSGEARAAVRIRPDPIFTEGTVLGRVFCDANGDGLQSPGEPGLAGVRVFLDTGFYVDSDIAGKFHFRGVLPGRHLLKVDEKTLPPNVQPSGESSRLFYVSKGLLTKANFALRCAVSFAKPDDVTLAPVQAIEDSAEQVAVIIDPQGAMVSLNGEVQKLPWLDAVVVSDGENAAWTQRGAMVSKGQNTAAWTIQNTAHTLFSQWEIALFDEHNGEEVWRWHGEGMPPTRLEWSPSSAQWLQAGRRYVYRIAGRTHGGDLAEGRWRWLQVKSITNEADTTNGVQRELLWRGELFVDADTDNPTKELKALVAQLAPTLAERPGKVQIEVHVPGGGNRTGNLVNSQRQALAVRALLVGHGIAENQIAAQGKGDMQPIMPNISRAGRAANRRIVVRFGEAGHEQEKPDPLNIEPLDYHGWLVLGDGMQRMPTERSEFTLPLSAEGAVALDLRWPSGQRLKLVRSQPFTDAPEEQAGKLEVAVRGSLGRPEITIGDTVVPMPLLQADCNASSARTSLEAEKLVSPMSFAPDAAIPLKTWVLRLYNPEGTILKEFNGAQNEVVTFDGTNEKGHVVVRPGRYGYQCSFEDELGNRATSSKKFMEIIAANGAIAAANAQLFDKALAGTMYPNEAALQPALLAEFAAVVALLQTKTTATLHIDVHDDAAGSKMQAQVRTARLAKTLREFFEREGIAAERLAVSAHGANRPVMPGDTRRARDLNRRVHLRVQEEDSNGANSSKVATSVGLRAGGVPLSINSDGTYADRVMVRTGGRLSVDLSLADGRSVFYQFPLTALATPGQATLGQPTVHAGSARDVPMIGSSAMSLQPPVEVENDDQLNHEGPQTRPPAAAPQALLEPNGRPPKRTPFGATTLLPASKAAPLQAPSGQTVLQPASQNEEIAAAPAFESTLAVTSTSAEAAAADVEVALPEDGAALRGERLTVWGKSHPANRITINGKVANLDEEGRFAETLVLPAGAAKVQLVSEDAAGNSAKFERSYTVPSSEWFAMGLADGVFGVGDKLEGMNEHTTINLPKSLYLHGRAVGYVKGRIKGSEILEKNPFETIRVTAHIDTGKQDEQDVLRQLIDPERYYPVYGDATEEVQDASSRYKVYLLVEADQSRLVVGNFQTRFRNMELFRYDRTFFGASIDVEHQFIANQTTEVHALAASGDAGIRHRQLSLQGTGGSLYFLRDRELIEGSERVEVVVRDAITGGRLHATPLMRDVGYRIDYREGRVILSESLPSTVMGGWNLNQTSTRAMQGHPIYLEVEYDFDASRATTRESAFAGQMRHSFGDRVTVGAAAVQEDRTAEGAGKYRLVSGEARVRIVGQTRLDMEVAYSQAEDAEHWASFDGGVTFGRLGMRRPERQMFGEQLSGWAGRLQITGDVADIMDTSGNNKLEQQVVNAAGASAPKANGAEGPEDEDGQESKATENSAQAASQPFLPYSAYVQHQDPGFFSGGSVFEQGQTKAGAQGRLRVTDKDHMRLRYDGAWSIIRFGEQERRINRQISSVGYEHAEENWKAGVEAGHNFLKAQDDDPINMGVFSVFGERTLLPRLVVYGEQEAIAGGDSRVLHSTWDRFATSLGARYQLTERLWLTATETVRWSGTNSTQVGLKATITEDFNVYASERLISGSGHGLVSTTVLGAETTAIKGSRSYAEYQLDALSSGRSGRAVFGMDNHWTLVDGLTLSLSYERAQRLGTPNEVFASPTGYAITDPAVAGSPSGTLNGQQQFAASGYNSAGMFPVGVASRDAFAVGLEYLRSKTFKSGARLEMRYDKVDPRQDTTGMMGFGDRMVFFGNAGADWRFQRNFVLLGRVNGASIHNMDVDVGGRPALDGQFMDLSLGLALRPAESDRFEALLKWTRRYDRRAINMERTEYQLQIADVVAFEPVLEVGFGFQLVGKLAMKVAQVEDSQLGGVRSTTFLALGRLNYHLTQMFDVGAEYRWLANTLTNESEHGALVEVAWVPSRYVSVGVGYNFSHFSDDLLVDPNLENHGFFLRVTGRF